MSPRQLLILVGLVWAIHQPFAASPEGEYAIPYSAPTRVSVTSALLRLKEHAEALSVPQVMDQTTHRAVEPGSAPIRSAVTDIGSYPIGVLHSGMLLAGEVTGDRRFTDYTARRLTFLGAWLPYFEGQTKAFGAKPKNLHDFIAPDSLDACGAWGAALVRAQMAGVGPDLRPVIDRWAEYVSHRQLRLPDGTLCRNRPQPQSLWADDMYMSVPFLAQLGRLTGKPEYFDDAARQVLQMSGRLWDPAHQLFAHGWDAGNADHRAHFFWGRANGWCLLAMCDLLDVLPESHPARPRVLELLRSHLIGLAALQSEDGRWRQLLDRADSHRETSGTAMFTYGFAHAVNRGWVSGPNFAPTAVAGWNGVAAQIGADGQVHDICVGTNLAEDAVYYYHRPLTDDVRGYGAVLLAGAEIIRLVENPRVKFRHEEGVNIFSK